MVAIRDRVGGVRQWERTGGVRRLHLPGSTTVAVTYDLIEWGRTPV